MRHIHTAAAVGIAALLLGTLSTGQPVQRQAASSATLVVKVVGLRNSDGRVWVDLFNKSEGFPVKREKASLRQWSTIRDNRAEVTFKGLPFGRYAAFVFHDEDQNGAVRTNWVGMPKEGVGASNNAKGRLGPPSFKAASFELRQAYQTLSISLRYL